jgi:hypothetical protein
MLATTLLLATAGTVQAYTLVNSGYIMRKNIDSIVQPGKYTSHMHSFFGNDAVNLTTSTTEELMSGCATNDNPNDLSVYCACHPALKMKYTHAVNRAPDSVRQSRRRPHPN